MTMASEMEWKTQNNLFSKFSLRHPIFRQGVSVSSDITMDPDNRRYSSDVTVECNNDNVILSYDIRNTEPYSSSNANYTGLFAIRHPGSSSEIMLSGHVASVDNTLSAATIFNYLSSRRENKFVYLRGEIEKLKQTLGLEVVTPVKSFNLNGKMMSKKSAYHMELEKTENLETNTIGELDIDTKEPSFDLKVYMDPGSSQDMYRISGKATKKSLSIESSRMYNQKPITDGLVDVKLSKSHLLHSKLNWNPDLPNDIKDVWSPKAEQLYRYTRDTLNDIDEEINMKKRVVAARSKAWTDPINNMGNGLYEMYNNNHFYVNDVCKVGKVASRYASEKIDKLKDYVNGFNYNVIKTVRKVRSMSGDYAGDLEWLFDNVHTYIQYARETIWNIFEEYKDNINNYFEDTNSGYERVKPVYGTENDYLNSLKEMYNNLGEKYYEFLYDVKSKVGRNLQQLWEHPHVEYARGFTNSAYEQAKWAYDYWDIPNTLQDSFKHFISNWKETIEKYSYTIADHYLHYDEYKVLQFEPASGKIEFTAHIPYELKDLKTLPDLPDLKKLYNKVQNRYYVLKHKISDFLPDKDFSLRDMYYAYKPKSMMDVIPPFSAHAGFSGSQHFMTFDKNFFEFAGECSYVLVHDFSNGNFSVVVNYNKKADGLEKSILVISNDKQIELLPEFKVKVDDRKADLPLEFGNTTVTRHGHMIVITNTKGLTVKCDLAHDYCMLYMSGWYFGKTAGLLGSYDNEPANDFIDPDKNFQMSATDFANSWNVGLQCRSSANLAVDTRARPLDADVKFCESLFKADSSPLQSCFKQVDPVPFMDMCLNDLSGLRRLVKLEDTCNAAAFYVQDCKAHGVLLDIPDMCITCEMPGNKIVGIGESVTLTKKSIPKAVDIVFVIQESQCNKDLPDKHLGDIIKKADKAFGVLGMKDVRFGFVGYGGEGVHGPPHIHTLDGDVLASSSQASLALRTLDFAQEDSEADGLSAIAFAAKYPFRAGAAREIVLITCDTCSEEETSYIEMQKLMLERDISIHIILDGDMKHKGTHSKKIKSHIFGMDNSAVFTNKHARLFPKKFAGDSSLRSQVSPPKDICVALALESNGTTWDRKQLTEGRPRFQKMFRDVISRALAKFNEPSECQICECVPDVTSVGIPVCRQCEMPTFSPLEELPWTEDDEDDNTTDDEEDNEVDSEEDNSSKKKKNAKSVRKPIKKKFAKKKNAKRH